MPPKVVDGSFLIQATLTPAADSPAAAINLDVRHSSERDLRVTIPAITLVGDDQWPVRRSGQGLDVGHDVAEPVRP